MLKFLAGLLASISSIFISGANKQNVVLPLNTAIIAFQETYYAPAVADPEYFPWAKQVSEMQTPTVKPTITKTKPAMSPPPPPTSTTPISEPEDPYIVKTEPIINWLAMNLTLRGTSSEGNRTLPELVFNREYWRIEVFAYWAPEVIPLKPPVENDYFKLEVYEKGTNKLIYTMTSGTESALHKFQSFRKPGTYYFKTYAKNPSRYEITFTVSPKIVQ